MTDPDPSAEFRATTLPRLVALAALLTALYATGLGGWILHRESSYYTTYAPSKSRLLRLPDKLARYEREIRAEQARLRAVQAAIRGPR